MNLTNEQQKAVEELRKATQCLYIEVHESIADDVKQKSEAVIRELEQAQRERDEAQAQIAPLTERAVTAEIERDDAKRERDAALRVNLDWDKKTPHTNQAAKLAVYQLERCASSGDYKDAVRNLVKRLIETTKEMELRCGAMQVQRDQVSHLLEGGTLTEEQVITSGLGVGVLSEQRHHEYMRTKAEKERDDLRAKLDELQNRKK